MMHPEFARRLESRETELNTLYLSLYPDRKQALSELLQTLRERYESRNDELKRRDRSRETDPDWYKGNDLLGMCLYVDQFAGTLRGVKEKLGYLSECGVNYLHLMPFLDMVDGRSDGGYAVASFRKVKPQLGTMEDLVELTDDCHAQGISVCMDFVMNHTSEEHIWAKKARAGDPEYQNYYFFYSDRRIPDEYEKHVPQVFPTTAPGNFTYLEDIRKYVLTSFYPYQWDLNYANPAVFNAMADNMLFLANKGIDVIRVDAVPYIWKELGTDCRNLPQVHSIVRLMRLICEIVCPSVLLLGEVVMAPEKLAPYFGPVDRAECHMLYNATTMCTTWHTVATRDTRLLRRQTDTVAALPKEYVFLNYLRCHDDIGWGLDYPFLQRFGMEEVPHKAYLNAFF
nr:amylosucrase [Lachnospiraceae bacterium]